MSLLDVLGYAATATLGGLAGYLLGRRRRPRHGRTGRAWPPSRRGR